MLQAIKVIKELEDFLNSKQKEQLVINYKISLKLNMDIYALILVNRTDVLNYDVFTKYGKVNINEITIEDVEADAFYQKIFHNSDIGNIDLGLRRRFRSLLELDEVKTTEMTCPIITFYSYKGGMGRSTSLACFASYLSTHHSKTVVILDCDFEAPGFLDFFDLSSEILSKKNGLVEYILDKQFLDNNIEFNNYIYNVGKEYSGDGNIYIMPAGNLTDDLVDENKPNHGEHLKHYLESLSRIDFTNTENIVMQFNRILSDIHHELKPDIILIDSRTGFNDIFGLTSFYLSSAIVGFFGSNSQNIPGLHYLINSIYDSQKEIPIIIANSIISDGRYYEYFKKDLESYLNSNFDDPLSIETFPIFRETILEQIGTLLEYKNNFINFIKKPSIQYEEFMKGIINIAFNERKMVSEKKINEPKISKKETVVDSNNKIINLRKNILNQYIQHKPFKYAESTSQQTNYNENEFYFRKCMEEIFNRDRFLLLGSKGTGKTYLYKAFKEIDFIENLKKRMNKNTGNIEFINIISLEKKKQFSVLNTKFFEIIDSDFFFRRFWKIYIWNEIMLNQKIGFIPCMKPFSILNNDQTAKQFLDLINDDDKFIKLEKDLYDIDELLKNKDYSFFILFDQLDFIVKPSKWDKAISPLISLFREKPFNRIIPKLFLRSDLFEKLGNLTNIKELEIHSISLEWSKEELFAFFFKSIFAYAKDDFFKIMTIYGQFDANLVDEIEKSIGIHNQVPLHEKYLKPLVQTFFGKWADMYNKSATKYGENYDWFYKNLKNADDTISLRPFIDLLNASVQRCLENINKQRRGEHLRTKPILGSFYFAYSHVRSNAVKTHFNDLASEEGNKDLIKIFDYIQKELSLNLRKQTFERNEFHRLLSGVIKKYSSELEHQNVDDLKNLLIDNGIVSIYTRAGGYTSYGFALLYKYYLGLSTKRAYQNKNRSY